MKNLRLPWKVGMYWRPQCENCDGRIYWYHTLTRAVHWSNQFYWEGSDLEQQALERSCVIGLYARIRAAFLTWANALRREFTKLVCSMDAWMRLRQRLLFTIQNRAETEYKLAARKAVLSVKNARLSRDKDVLLHLVAQLKIEVADLTFRLMSKSQSGV